MTEQAIKAALLHLCKPSVLDSDFNVVAFHTLCDILKEIGAANEREACAKVCEDLAAAYQREHETAREDGADSCAIAILARGNT